MKNILFLTILVVIGFYSKSLLTNSYSYRNSLLQEMPKEIRTINLGIPSSLQSNASENELISFTEYVNINDEIGFVYCEMDDDEKFYHISYSENLDKFFTSVPKGALFKTWIEKDMNILTAGDDGPHTDCMEACDEKESKRGRCRWRCWIDTIIAIFS